MTKKTMTEDALVDIIHDIVNETLEIRVAERLEEEKKKWISETTIHVNKMLFEKINHLNRKLQLLTSK